MKNISIQSLIIYLRKSRSDDPYMSVEEVLSKHEQQLQEFALREFGEKIPEEHIYREVVSGETIDNRPVMLQLMKLLETGTIEGVLVIEPQRLSRGDLEDCGRIINVFRYTNTLVVTPPKTYDLTEEYDRKFFEMELTRGNDYLEYTKRILNRGRVASVKNGHFIGSVPPYGYRKVKIGTGKDAYHTLEIIPEEADALRLMYQMYLDGNGFTNIAKQLDSLGIHPRKSVHWSPAAISDMLENPVYIGKVRWNYFKTVKKISDGKIVKSRPINRNDDDVILVDGMHEAIIDENMFQAVQERRGNTPKIKRFNELQNPFAGLLYCSTCGTAMSYKKFYQSNKSHTVCESMICNKQSWCKTKSVKYSQFVDRVTQTMEDAIIDFEFKLQNEKDTAKLQESLIRNLENELKNLRTKDLRQKDAYEDGIYTKEEYAARNAKLQEKISETILAIDNAKKSIPAAIDYADKISRFKECVAILQDDSVQALTKNTMLKSCIQRIEYTNHMDSKPGIGRYVENEFSIELFLQN